MCLARIWAAHKQNRLVIGERPTVLCAWKHALASASGHPESDGSAFFLFAIRWFAISLFVSTVWRGAKLRIANSRYRSKIRIDDQS